MELSPSQKDLEVLDVREKTYEEIQALNKSKVERQAQINRTDSLRRKLMHYTICISDPGADDDWLGFRPDEETRSELQVRVVKTPAPKSTFGKQPGYDKYALQARFARSKNVTTEPVEVIRLEHNWNCETKRSISISGEFGLVPGEIDLSLGHDSDIDPAAIDQLLEIEGKLLDPVVAARAPHLI